MNWIHSWNLWTMTLNWVDVNTLLIFRHTLKKNDLLLNCCIELQHIVTYLWFKLVTFSVVASNLLLWTSTGCTSTYKYITVVSMHQVSPGNLVANRLFVVKLLIVGVYPNQHKNGYCTTFLKFISYASTRLSSTSMCTWYPSTKYYNPVTWPPFGVLHHA